MIGAGIAFALALGITVYPLISTWYNDRHQSKIHTQYIPCTLYRRNPAQFEAGPGRWDTAVFSEYPIHGANQREVFHYPQGIRRYVLSEDAVRGRLPAAPFYPYLCPERLGRGLSIPPGILITSSRDSRYHDSWNLYESFPKIHTPFQIRNYGEDPHLYHAFCVAEPELPESRMVIHDIVSFFHET